jgi:abequosyltransferase
VGPSGLHAKSKVSSKGVFSMRPILSILVPTYNRSVYLGRLLAEIESQLGDPSIVHHVEVLIGDNGSRDATREVAISFTSRNCNWLYTERAQNLGPDANMLALLESAKGVYCWIIGDDDLPRAGLISHLLECLSTFSPSLLYLDSIWAPDISVFNLPPLTHLRLDPRPPLEYASRINIWTTFISAWVFNVDALCASANALSHAKLGLGTHFVQLGWILPLLSSSGPFLASSDPCILATSANTGNYSSLEVFGINYSRQVLQFAPSRRLADALINPFLISFLPVFVASVKRGADFSPLMTKAGPSIYLRIIREHSMRPSFYLFALPVILLPSAVIRRLHPIAKLIKYLCEASLSGLR